MSAAAFAKGLLDLEGQLTPILVSKLVNEGIWLCHENCVWLTQLSFWRFPLSVKIPLCWMDLTVPVLR